MPPRIQISNRPGRVVDRNRQLLPVELRESTNPILNGIHSTTRYTVSVRHSSRVHVRSLAGNALTVEIIARNPVNTYNQFQHMIWPTLRRLGQNSITRFGRLIYTLQFNITLRTLRTTRQGPVYNQFNHDLIIFPCRAIYDAENNEIAPARTITSTSRDFQDEDHNELLFENSLAEFSNYNGSGASLVSVNSVEVQLVKVRVNQQAGTYFQPPDCKFTCINVQNDDNKCFMWSILAGIFSKNFKDYNHHLTETYKDKITWCNWEGIEFPADFETACSTFENNNTDIALHVWKRLPNEIGRGKWESFPVRVSPREREPDVDNIDLYLAEDDDGNYHYLYIKDIHGFLYWSKTPKEALCRVCLTEFDTKNEYTDHIDTCNKPVPFKIFEYYLPEGSVAEFDKRKVTDRMEKYVVLNADTEVRDGESRITHIQYLINYGGTYLNTTWLSVIGENPVHWLMHRLQGKEYTVIVKNSSVLHQIIVGLDDYGADLYSNMTLTNTRVDDTNMSCLRMGSLRFIDTGRFFNSKATDVYELNSEWIKFIEFCLKNYGLDPLNFYTLPSFAWNSALKYTRATPAYITNPFIYEFIRRAKRGGINIIPHRYFKPNNTLLPDYDDTKESLYLANFDIKSSYGYSMKQPLPIGGYFRVSPDELKSFTRSILLNLDDNHSIGYFFEVDLTPPNNIYWQNRHSDLPLAPDKRDGRLMCTLEPKKNYVVHYRLLKFYLKRGMILDKVHDAVGFYQSRWLAPFIELQEKLRSNADDSMNTVIKLITNSVFGKSCINPFKNNVTKLYRVHTKEGRESFARHGFDNRTVMVRQVSPGVILTSKLPGHVTHKNHLAVGTAILELGKLQLYETWYNKLIPRNEEIRLLYCDTDSLIVSMKRDPVEFMTIYPEFFESKAGNLKEESGGSPGSLFIGAKPKHYMYETLDSKRVRISGLTKEVSSKLDSSVFIDVLDNGATASADVNITKTVDHHVTTVEQHRNYLDNKDHTRYYIDEYRSVPFGHIHST